MRGTSKASAAKAKPKPMNLKRLRTRIGVPAALIAVLLLALPGSASAALGDTEEFFAPTQPTKPHSLVEGPDGNVWYTDSTVTKIGKVTPSGTVEEFSPGLTGPALNITAGPESKLWFTEKSAKKIGSINTSGAGLTECTVAGEPESIAAAGGNLWFTFIPTGEAGVRKIGKLIPGGGCSITVFTPGVTSGFASTSVAATIIAGGDGNLYYGTVGSTKVIGKITLPAETFTEFTVNGANPNHPHSLTYGGDGRIWFVAQNATEERIGAITTNGATTTYYNTGLGGLGAGGANLSGLATGADGNVWARETAFRQEKQKLKITAGAEDLGGTYILEFNGDKTAPIAWNASASEVEAALGAIPSIGGVANVKVITGFTGGGLVERSIEFEGKFARTDVPPITCDVAGLTGTTPACTLELVTTAVPEKLYRFKPNGEFIIFPLLPRTRTVTPAATTLGKNGTLVPGPGKDLWYTTAGDVNFPATTAIGKFDLAVVEAPEFALSVIKEGTGDGTVVSNPSGIECDPTCSADFKEGEKVILKASPDSESLFVSWKGCETGGVNGRECKVTVDKAKSVTAKFIQAYDVTVNRVGTGLGKVGSSPGGVLCLSNCSSTTAAFKEATNVVLTATPSKNYTFTEWTGDCSGSGTCSLSALSADKTVGAKFTAVPQHLLTVTKSGGGAGTVKAAQAGINCGATCSSMAAAYFQGAVVELTATPGKGSTFGGWSGSGCSGTGTCTVTMSAAKSVTAEFK